MPSLPSPRGKSRPRLEIIPFIDIMFFLLATFMMVSLSMIKNESIAVNLPKASTGTKESRDLSYVVTITREGVLHLNKDVVSLEDLKQRLAKINAQNPNTKFFVNGDEHADFGQAVEVLDEIRSTGITKVSIQTKKVHRHT